MSVNLVKRSEVPVEETWDLSTIFKTDEAWEEALVLLEADKDILVSYSGKLGDSAQNLYGFLSTHHLYKN